ncbi:hypothetical protein ISS08_00885 [Candidatus Pacearchaeota archaeon]|nr:hypothetical protein [Candidatus Pacearchaeota archaeon]
MKTIKDKIILEGKKIGASLIPGAFLNKKYINLITEENSKKGYGYGFFNFLPTFVGAITTAAYLGGVIDTHVLDFTKWDQIYEKREEKQLQLRKSFEERVLDKAYLVFDTDSNNSISKNEFEQSIEKSSYRRFTGEGHLINFYDRLNWDFELGEEYIKVREREK